MNVQISSLVVAQIGGASMDTWDVDTHGHATELDSHANMAVAGWGTTVIATTGRYATVTPFSGTLPAMDKVEIADVAMAFDDPLSTRTYILVMRNALYIPTMGHNLIPPFILREAGLWVDETPKFQLADKATIDNHCIHDPETGLRIHLQLNGIFSYFPTRPLTVDEQYHWDNYPVIFITPDGAVWDPHSLHFGEEEAAMVDADGLIVHREPRPQHHIFTEAELSELYADPVPLDVWMAHVDENLVDLADDQSETGEFDPFPHLLFENATSSKVAMAMGSTTYDNSACELFEDVPVVAVDVSISAVTAGKPGGVSAERLAKLFSISHDDATRTLSVTTQLNRQSADSNLSRNFGTNDRMLRYRRIKSTFFTDTLYATAKAKSTRGNTCAQIFVSDKGFVSVYPMRDTKSYLNSLKQFAKDIGAPDALVCDSHPTQKKREVRDFCAQIGTTLRVLEANTQWANRAELYVGLIKEATRKDMRETDSPIVLWDYCMERRASIFQVTAKKLFQLNGTNPHTATFGTEADISHLCQFGWYEWVYFRDQAASYPYPKECLGRCLGPAKNEGNEMAQWVLRENGKVVVRRSLRRLTPHELAPSNEVEVAKRAAFNNSIRATLGDSITTPPTPLSDDPIDDWDLELYEDDDVGGSVAVPEADFCDATGKPVLQQSFADTLINAEVLLPHEESTALATVLRRTVDANGNMIGTYDDHPLLNTMVYDCMFPDGTIKEYAANVIAVSIMNGVDEDGYAKSTSYSIIDHKRSGDAIRMEDKYFVTKTGTKRLRQTTKGWSMLIEWSDGRRQWMDLKLLKQSNQLQVAEYAAARGLVDEPAFAWWVPYTLRKRDVIVSAVKLRRTTHKYGIEVPRTLAEALALDAKNGNNYWSKATGKEMGNIVVAFDILGPGEKPPPGWTKSSGHLVFDVKMDFTRKARWVKDGHRTPDAITPSYAGVVSRDSIRIALVYAKLLGLQICGGDIRNAYLQAPSSEKHYIICGPEFGLENEGRCALIKRALYGGKVAGADFWHHLRSCMNFLGFTSSRADPDVWFRSAKRTTGEEYYEYVLLYVDDVLVLSDRAEQVLRQEIGQQFVLKEESIGKPTQYLGGKLREVTLENGVSAWSFSSSQYVQAAVKNVEQYLSKKGEKLVAKAPTPLSNGYRPEIDISPECGSDDASYFQSLIGVLRWMVELGRVDICIEVSMMSSHLALPRIGHLKEVLHIFAYLKKHHNSEMVFDPTPVDFDRSLFEKQDWSFSQYGCEELVEELPDGMPEPRGQSMTMRVFVDSDHAGDLLTRRSRTGFVVLLNGAPIYWNSKKQTSCETSTFGSEFVAMKQATEFIRGLRYKLRMMGIPVNEPAFVFGDNQSVLANTSAPASTLKKKSNAIAYHFVREGCARDEWRTAYVNTHDNVADLFTKPLPSGEKRQRFVRMLLHHL